MEQKVILQWFSHGIHSSYVYIHTYDPIYVSWDRGCRDRKPICHFGWLIYVVYSLKGCFGRARGVRTWADICRYIPRRIYSTRERQRYGHMYSIFYFKGTQFGKFIVLRDIGNTFMTVNANISIVSCIQIRTRLTLFEFDGRFWQTFSVFVVVAVDKKVSKSRPVIV